MTNIERIQFASSIFIPRPEPPWRAAMPLIVTVRGFAAWTLVPDLAEYLAESLAWGELYQTIIPLDSVPLGAIDIDALAKKVGSTVVALSPSQPAPIYEESSYQSAPDSAVVRLELDQIISEHDADRDMLLDRRRDLIHVLAPISGEIP